MLGRYDEFPSDAPCYAQFTYLNAMQTLQTAIVQALRRLNQEPIDLATLTPASPPNCCVNFEFGVADRDAFNFLDQKETSTLEKAFKAQLLPILDVFCAARYHVKKEKGKDKSLQFDYSVLRFTFENKDIELFLHHIRGIQRIPRKDLILFLKSRIDQELIEKQHETLILKNLF